jgi:hypothetical protein
LLVSGLACAQWATTLMCLWIALHPSARPRLRQRRSRKSSIRRHHPVELANLLAAPDVHRLVGPQKRDKLLRDWPVVTAAYMPFKDNKLKPHELLVWWRENGHKTGSWAAAARIFVLCQPNSELAERAGAILRARTSDQQGQQLEETFEISSMLAYSYAEKRNLSK